MRSATLEKDRSSRSFHNIVSFIESVENLGYSGLQELADYLDEQGVGADQPFRTRVAQVRMLLDQQMETVKTRYLVPAIEYMKTSLKHFAETKGGEGNQHRLGYYKELCTFFGTEFSH